MAWLVRAASQTTEFARVARTSRAMTRQYWAMTRQYWAMTRQYRAMTRDHLPPRPHSSDRRTHAMSASTTSISGISQDRPASLKTWITVMAGLLGAFMAVLNIQITN